MKNRGMQIIFLVFLFISSQWNYGFLISSDLSHTDILEQNAAAKIQRFTRLKQAEIKGLPNQSSIEKVRNNIAAKPNIEGEGILIENIEHIDLDQQGYPTLQAIKQLFIAQHYFKADQEIVVDVVPTGSNSDKIYSISIDDKPIFFAKISKSYRTSLRLSLIQKGIIGRVRMESFYEDAKLLKNLPILTWIEKIFVYTDSQNKSRNIEISHAAKGTSVLQILKTGDLELKIKCMKSLGRSLGYFQQLSMDYCGSHDAEQWRTIVHGDFYSCNVYFDEAKSQIYYIDNESMGRRVYIFEDISNIFTELMLYQVHENSPLRLYNTAIALIGAYIETFPHDKQLTLAECLKSEKFIACCQNLGDSKQFLERAFDCYLNKIIALTPDANLKKHKISSLHVAVAKGSIDQINRLLDSDEVAIDSKDIEGDTPLFWAVHAGNQDIIKLLVHRGADIDIKNTKDNNSLVCYAAGMDNITTLSTLLELGADANASGRNKSPLYIAAILGSAQGLQLLLQAPQIDVDNKALYSLYALYYILDYGYQTNSRYLPITQMLIDAGANLTPQMRMYLNL